MTMSGSPHSTKSARSLFAAVLVLAAVTGCASAPAGETAPSPSSEAADDEARPAVGRSDQEVPPDSLREQEAPSEAEAARAVLLAGIDLDTVRAGRFDQGKMWTLEFPPVDYFEAEYGVRLDSTWFREVRLSALRIPGCSASFVSRDGLVMTNHHCARDFVSQVSEEGENLLDEGFYARSLSEERPVEDFTADQLVEIVDITPEVRDRTRGLEGGNLTEATEAALEAIGSRMQEELGGEDEGWVVEPISLYNGARFSAYVFRRYTEAKLVMAPELQIGFYGGDPDNFTYPRYNLDFAFFRLYDEDGEPFQAEHFFRWGESGAGPGDPVFVVGNPGSTSRLQTVAQLEFRRDVGDRYVLDFIRRRADVLEAFIAAHPEEVDRYDLRNALFGMRNQEKAMTGRIGGLHEPEIIARRLAAERELMDSIQKEPVLVEEYGGVFEEIAELQTERREHRAGLGAFLGLTAEDFASPTLHRAFLGVQVLNVQRAGRNADDLMDRLRAVQQLPAQLDRALVEARILDFVGYFGEESEVVQSILGGRSPAEAADFVHANSALSDSAGGTRRLELGEIDPGDPALDFVRAYVPELIAYQEASAGINQLEEQHLRDLGRVRFEVYGASQPPDATFSLRIADGIVRGYDYNGTVAPPITTFFGLYDRHHGHAASYGVSDSPWALPDRWREPPEGLDLSAPVNFVSTADIISGNSGSPVIDVFRRVVGLIFDGNIESLPGDYIYLPEKNRSVAVDVRGILEALEHAYEMDPLVEELRSGRRPGAG